ncbi:MAG TPA: DUF3365 domain-containing protein [Nitrospira sp.]|nr:DUF3365 domain-containing protein [Nitrospira sp.]
MQSILFVLWIAVLIGPAALAPSVASEERGIPPETVTDYLHAVIEADRTFYSIHVVERLQKSGAGTAAENWRSEKNVLPLPAQFLMESNELASKTGANVRYRLVSLWPINPRNAPDSAAERAGLEAVSAYPERSVTGTVKQGDRTYFQAIYADRAVSRSCIDCHNAHPESPRKDFKLHDVMGGLVIEIPLGAE